MSYSITNSTIFPHPPGVVFAGLCRLDDYHLWHSGMIAISKTGMMIENMLFETETIINGQSVKANVEVVRLVPNIQMELLNRSGGITYRALWRLLSERPNETELICMLQFEFNSFTLDLARPVIESMAEIRLKARMETLRTLLSS